MGNSLPVSACEACNVYRFCKSCAFGCFQCLNTIIIAFIIIYHAIVFFDVCECKITRYCDNLDIFCFFLLLGLFRIILCFNSTVYYCCGTVYLLSVWCTDHFYFLSLCDCTGGYPEECTQTLLCTLFSTFWAILCVCDAGTTGDKQQLLDSTKPEVKKGRKKITIFSENACDNLFIYSH